MRLCFVGSLSNVHTQRWVRFFAQRGHDVYVIATTPKTEEPPNGKVYLLRVHRTGTHYTDLFLAVLSLPLRMMYLRRLIRKIAPDVLHVHYVNEAALFAILTGFRPIVLTAWGSDVLISPATSWVRKQAAKYTLKRADLITCDADHMKRRIAEFGADPERIKVIFFGTDTEKYHPGERDCKLRWQLAPEGGPIVISIRNLEPLYDVESLIRAIPAVRELFPDILFLVGGSGSLGGILRDLAAGMGIQRNVRFLGTLTQEQLPAYLASADVYVSTAVSDAGLAASTAEAMACGLPVVVTDVGDNRQWVEDGKTGFLVPPKQPESIANVIIKLLKAEDLRLRIGTVARQVIADRNNFRTEMSRMEGLYEGLVESRAVHKL